MSALAVIVGAGPRAAGLLHALRDADLPKSTEIVLLERPADAAASPWRIDQPECLLANSFASHVTIARPGQAPGTLLEWCARVSSARPPVTPRSDRSWVDEARELSALDFPSRRLVGRYVAAAIDAAVVDAPFRVHRMVGDVVDVAPGPTVRVTLACGGELRADAVVLATGVDDAGPRAHAAPGSPVRLADLPSGGRVLVRGLGLTFHDVVARVTAGRGGRFEHVGGRLRYLPSGREPRLWATSRTGIPIPPKAAPTSMAPAAVGHAHGHQLLVQGIDDEAARAAVVGLLAAVLEPLGHAWLLDTLGDGTAGTRVTAMRALAAQARAARATDTVVGSAQAVVVAALEAVVGPVLDPPHDLADRAPRVMRALESVGSRLTSGPPARRTLELSALVEAGIVTLAGGERRLRPAGDGWILETADDGPLPPFPNFVDARVHPRTPAWAAGAGWPRRSDGLIDVDPRTSGVRWRGASDDDVLVVGPAAGVGAIATLPRPGGPSDFFDQNDTLAATLSSRLRAASRSSRAVSAGSMAR